MENADKQNIKLRLGITLQKIISNNKAFADANKDNPKKANKSVISLRKLAASAGIEFAIIQKVSSGSKNAEITTLVGIADGLGMSMQAFFSVFDSISEMEILEEKVKRDRQKGKRSKKK